MPAISLVFVHGWSVTNLDTYGNLPNRIKAEGKKNGFDIDVTEIFLGRYISFHDEVRLPDISRAFNTAVAEQLPNTKSFIAITHSTGGPVMRDWQDRYCKGKKPATRMTHLVMLAPANFGSALAILGKGTLSRLQSWWNGIEPGQGVLDWLCLGSAESWKLNTEWIRNGADQVGTTGFFPFVLTGQSIDRKLYDALNSYTGETGSDGVVRVAAANLNATYIRLEQPRPTRDKQGKLVFDEMKLVENAIAPATPLRIISGKAHSGKTMGIMYSVGEDDAKSMETVNAILDCISVKTQKDYDALTAKFATETARVQQTEQVEVEKRMLLKDRYFIHDRYTQIIFRVSDSEGYPITDFDLLLTGPGSDPNLLPEGFFVDRQLNKSNRNTVSYFINYDIMVGAEKITADGKTLRERTEGISELGIKIVPRPDAGFVKYMECRYTATKQLFNKALSPNSTTLIEVVMQRIVDKEVFRMEENISPKGKEFSKIKPSGDIID